MILRVCISFLVLFSSVSSFGQEDLFQKVREYTEKSDSRRAFSELKEIYRKNEALESEEKKDMGLTLVALGILAYQLDEKEDAELFLSLALQKKAPLQDYTRFYLGKLYAQQERVDEAQTEFVKVRQLKPNRKGYYDATFELALIAMKKGHWRSARRYLRYLERRRRGGTQYPEIIWHLVGAEKNSKRSWHACRWARKLYSRFPGHSLVRDWGVQLQKVDYKGTPLGCLATKRDQERRIKYLQRAGLSEKAQEEIYQIQKLSSSKDAYFVDKLWARYFVHEGHMQEALKILLPHFEREKRNHGYLNLLATTSARAGETAMAVGMHMRIYNLYRRSRIGRKALYRAAFLSYQNQDYDGASRKYREFIRRYRRSGLSRDARWYLGWMEYLRGDYKRAHASFKKILKLKKRYRRRWRRYKTDRLEYWKAMSLMKMGKIRQAKQELAELSKDNLLNFYTVSSLARSSTLKGEKLKRMVATLQQSRIIPYLGEESLLEVPEGDDEENESEEKLKIDSDDDDDNSDDDEDKEDEKKEDDAEKVNNVEVESKSDNGEEVTLEDEELDSLKVTNFRDPRHSRRFARARLLRMLGFRSWSRWELYAIERRTSHRDYLKTLMSEYHSMGAHHRSAYIGQIFFATERQREGIDGVRYLWQYTYPQAYEKDVKKAANQFGIDEELIWGVMRTESHYRKDALSPVGAMGLMQVMPYTGHQVAKLLRLHRFRPEQLLEPSSSILVGGRYLKRLMKKFKEKIPLVAAGYNAGPHRVQSWLKSFGHLDMDEFIEHIPFSETRNYVKKVVSSYYIYSYLYKKKKNTLPYIAEPTGVTFDGPAPTRENWEM